MAGKDPAMPFYVNDWLSSAKVTCMTLEQQGAFVRLLCHCWASQTASIPDDDNVLAALSGMGQGWLTNGCPVVRDCFVPNPHQRGYLTNERLLQLWKERQEWRRKSSIGGRKSAANKALKAVKGGTQMVATKRQPNVNSSSSSSSSSNYSLSESNRGVFPPSVEMVSEYCSERKNSIDAETFVNFYASKGWMVGKNKMKDWRACVRTWEKSQHERTVGTGGRGGSAAPTLLDREQQREADQLDVIARWAAGDSVPATGVRDVDGSPVRIEANGVAD